MFRTKATSGVVTNIGGATANGTSVPKTASLTEALKQYNVERDIKLAFVEPRGLKNMGLTCYMNSILQLLMYCTPFYSFLDLIRQRTVQNMKSETPLIDAMVMLINEFKVLASADSVESLRKQLRHQQLEQFGEQIAPKFFYDTLRQLPRFKGMKLVGEQQDAEEFLGFLLEGLHAECASVILSEGGHKPQSESAGSDAGVDHDDGWMEVQKKQKAAVTRTAGHSEAPTPITRIFGGYLRSEIRASGSKDSVTRELFERLQLDIGATHVTNIVEALKGITRLEPIADFGKPGVTAKKQVFVDSLPPVLVLHLKRFEYDSSVGRTQKIWKKVGYPLDLEVPKEVFPPSKRGGLAAKGGLPKYRLIGVVYHHGKTAAGGHYTVDVRRQDGEEWIRIDDTIIRRIRKEDVAEGGSEEDPKILAQALEQHKADQELQRQRNMYQGLDEADKEPEAEGPWSHVNGSVSGHKKNYSMAATTNGASSPRTPTAKAGLKDDKVAYILMYEKV
ncbi:cysteine proteinase [Teratosphaeria nubilosa]|uniref:ubiquitinyl hydrolase 1 n=1 Tax=Teratosphaeria nubilosa TaxID=161662 RepID=A0A6G1L9D8_9PEZI|nr:cysteine proteinase [Teratosphaeria nubilosa]